MRIGRKNIFAATIAALGLITTATAQPNDRAFDDAMQLAPFIERDAGLTREQFRAYLDKESIAFRAQGEVADLVGEQAFGGFIMHRREDNTYENRALLTDLSRSDEVRKLGADAVVQVKYSLAALNANHKAVLRTVEQLQV